MYVCSIHYIKFSGHYEYSHIISENEFEVRTVFLKIFSGNVDVHFNAAASELGDVPETESDLTKRLNERALAARSHEKWRREYMTLQERDELMREEGRKEGREEGRKEGREEGRKEGTEIANLYIIKNLMETLEISAEKAIDLVKIPAEEREKYLAKM